MTNEELREKAGRLMYAESGFDTPFEELSEFTRNAYIETAWPVFAAGLAAGLREAAAIDKSRSQHIVSGYAMPELDVMLEARAKEVENAE